MITRLSAVLVGLAMLASCAPVPEPGTPAATAAQQQRKEEARASEVKASVEEAPSWFINPPKDDLSIYAPATATSGDMQLALDKATLSAKRSLADNLTGLLSSKMKEFISESGSAEDATVTRESERVTSNLITETNLAGYQRTQSKVVPQGTQYRAYVLLQYPMGSANRVLVDRVKENRALEGKLRASKAFQDLEKEIQDARTRSGK
ncbi:MAG: hypothetical protein EPN20_12090 [Magnetospirillum sp.]|nr:MAG: hypothetical protein EPN20_12090 [Magnetospirillum sp.]